MLKVNTAATLSAACRVYNAGRISDHIFHASVCEAAKAGINWRTILIIEGIDPASLPAYASLSR